MDRVEAAPTTEEAQSLLEKRKHVEVPSEEIRGKPCKKSTAKKKAKTSSPAEKKLPEEVESLTPQGLNIVHSVMSIAERRLAGVEKWGGSFCLKSKPTAQDKGKRVAERSGETSPQSYEKVYNRRIHPHRDDAAFTEIGYKDLITRLNRASRNMLNEKDMEYLEAIPPVERTRQARFSAVEVSIRLLSIS